LHRDIKPANILIDESDRIWLVDFGLSKALPTRSHGKSGTTALGTVGYTPLEQWLQMAVPASDIYALGATLHHLLTGHDPREAFPIQPDLPQIQQEHGNFLPIRQVDEMFSEQLEALVSRAVDRLPTRRPTAEQFKHSLEELLAPAKALPPFHFRDGKAACKPRELVPLSLEHWQEAREYLYHGPFQAWFKVLGRYDLESQVRNLTLKEQIPDIALDKFLRLLDRNLPPPRVELTTEGTNFGHYNLSKNIRLSAKVKVTNYGPGCFYGTSHLQQEWLKVYPKEFALPPIESQDFIIQVQGERLVWNTTYQNQLTIDGSSQQKQFPLILHTSSRISVDGTQFALELGFIIFCAIVLCLIFF
jgi:serine/threonine protein kinase